MGEFEIPNGPEFGRDILSLQDFTSMLEDALIVSANRNKIEYTDRHKRLAKQIHNALFVYENNDELYHVLRGIGSDEIWKVNKVYSKLYGGKSMFDDFYAELWGARLLVAMELLGFDLVDSMRKRGKLRVPEKEDDEIKEEKDVDVKLTKDVPKDDPEKEAMYRLMKTLFGEDEKDKLILYRGAQSLTWKGGLAARKAGTTFTVKVKKDHYITALKAMYGGNNSLTTKLIDAYVENKKIGKHGKLIKILQRIDELTEVQATMLRNAYVARDFYNPIDILDEASIFDLDLEFQWDFYGNNFDRGTDLEALIATLSNYGLIEVLTTKNDPDAKGHIEEIAILLQTNALVKGWKASNFQNYPEARNYVSLFQTKALGRAFEMLKQNEKAVETEYWKYKNDSSKLAALVKVIRHQKNLLTRPNAKDLKGVKNLILTHPISSLVKSGVSEEEIEAMAARYQIDEETINEIMEPTKMVSDGHDGMARSFHYESAPEEIPSRVAGLSFFPLMGVKGFLTEYLLMYNQKVYKNKGYSITAAITDIENKYGMKKALENFNKGVENLRKAGEEGDFQVLKDLSFDFQKISAMNKKEAQEAILEGLLEKKENAREVRSELNYNPDKVWEMAPVVQITSMELGQDVGFTADVIRQKIKAYQDSQFWTDIGLGALGLVLGVAGFFTGGLTTAAGIALLTGSVALSVFEVVRESNKHAINEAISNTALNEANELGNIDSSWLGVILAVVGLGFDFAAVVKALKLAKTAKSFQEGLGDSIKVMHESLDIEAKLGYTLEKFQDLVTNKVSTSDVKKLLLDKKFKEVMVKAFGVPFDQIPSVASYGLAEVKRIAPKVFDRIMKEGIDVITLNRIAVTTFENPQIGISLQRVSNLLSSPKDFRVILETLFRNSDTQFSKLHLVLGVLSEGARKNLNFLKRILLDPEIQAKILREATDGQANKTYSLYLEFLKGESKAAKIANGDFKKFLQLSGELALEAPVGKFVKTALGEDDLSKFALDYRKRLAEPMHKGNVAVYEYVDNNGNLVKKAFTTESIGPNKGKHAEKIADDFYTTSGIPKDNVTRVYSELEPCELESECKNLLLQSYPNAKVTYSFDYPGGLDNSVRANSLNMRKEELQKLITK